MRLYVASSWRNPYYGNVLSTLRSHHDCYDFKNPPGGKGVRWQEVVDGYLHGDTLTADQLTETLSTPRAQEHFAHDFGAMKWADACVLVAPCGRSAHLELGWFIGAGKPAHVLMLDAQEPELMYGMVTSVHDTINGLLKGLA